MFFDQNFTTFDNLYKYAIHNQDCTQHSCVTHTVSYLFSCKKNIIGKLVRKYGVASNREIFFFRKLYTFPLIPEVTKSNRDPVAG